MRNLSRYSAAVLAAFSFSVAACGDDEETTPTPDTNNGTDTNTDTDTNTGTDGSDTTTDTDTDTDTPVNACEDVTCDAPPAPSCDGNSVVSYAATGTCNEDTGACSYAQAATTPCNANEVCSAGVCIAAGDLCSYEFGARVSYVTEIRIPGSGEPACCFDLNGDGTVDNKLSGLLNTLSNLASIDVNGLIAEQIEAGSIALLLETKNVTDIANSSNVTINGFYGADADEDLSNNAAGTSAFIASSSSFISGTAQPYIAFQGAKIENSVLTAGPSQFRLQIPVLGILLDLAINGTQIEAPVSAGAAGPTGGLAWGGADGAKLGGYVALSTLATALDTYLSTECTCLGKNDASKPYVYTQVENSKDIVKLNVVAGAECTGTCEQIGSYATMASGLVGSLLAPDIDHDFDGILESISLGVRLKATSATVSGIDTCE